MVAKMYRYPSKEKNTRIWQWLQAAQIAYEESNMIGARVWVIQNVPEQFRDVIVRNIMR